MTKVAITESYLEDIADAIRSKTGVSSATYYPSEMADAIMTISGGGGITPTGTISITENGTYNVTSYASANVEVPTGSTINNQNKTVTPSASQQTITADSGYTGLGTVTINGDEDLVASNIKKNVSIFGVTGTYEAGSSSPTIQSLTVTPSESQQTFNASGVDGYKPVVVNATPKAELEGLTITASPTMGIQTSQGVTTVYSGYEAYNTYSPASTAGWIDTEDEFNVVAQINGTYTLSNINFPISSASTSTSGYTSKATISRSTSDQYINIPTGYNSAGVYYKISAVANGSATPAASISGTSATITTGTNTITLTKSVSNTPQVTAGYISSGTAGNSSVSLTASVTVNPTPIASGATVTIPAGYYSSQTTKSVSSGSASAPSTISGTSATVSTGTNTLTLTKTVSVTPVVSAGYVSSGTATNSSVSLTASVTTKAAATITPGTTNQTIASGTYLTGTQTIAGDADLVASNIVSGVQIFGVTGNVVLQNYYTGSSAPSSSTGSNGDLYLQS